jgi:hypothetical protein
MNPLHDVLARQIAAVNVKLDPLIEAALRRLRVAMEAFEDWIVAVPDRFERSEQQMRGYTDRLESVQSAASRALAAATGAAPPDPQSVAQTLNQCGRLYNEVRAGADAELAAEMAADKKRRGDA